MDIKEVASILLIGRLVSATFISLVIKRQLALFKKPIDPGLVGFRRILFFLSLAVLVGNIIPIVLDVATILAGDSLHREDSPSLVGVSYAFSNCITSAISAILIWTMYRQAAKTVILVDHEIKVALNKNK